MKELKKGLEVTHRLVREALADFLMIPFERVSLAVVNAEGLDAEIAALCASIDAGYWDNMNYCRTHRDSQMKVYKELVSCREILAHRKHCRRHIDETISIDGSTIPCDRFFGIEDDYSPWDEY